MSDTPPIPPVPKAIGSLVKKQADVTRQGTQKLKFVPTLPQRRKKEEANAELANSSNDRDHETGRGRGRGRGRGAPPVVEMTASGPFAMGPTLASSSIRRSTPRSNFAPTASVPRTSISFGDGHAPPSLKDIENTDDNKKSGTAKTEDDKYYSDPDEGVEIVDMENVHQMDWMAPDSIKCQKSQKVIETDDGMREERLYLFQFPTPFPTFFSKMIDVSGSEVVGKKVSFAADTKPDTLSNPSLLSIEPSEPKKLEPISGVIGQLEIYRSGRVKIRLTNDIILNLNAATQPSFLQQAVNLDMTGKQLIVLGEVNKQFVVSPNVEVLLGAMEDNDNAPILIEGGDNLIRMDS